MTKVRVRYSAASEGGWVLFRLDSGLSGALRFVRDDRSRLRPSQLVTDHRDGGLGGSDLREFPLGQLEAVANGELRDELLRLMDRPVVPVWRRHNGRYRDELPAIAHSETWEPNLTLAVPRTRPYPEDFWGDVAIVYQRAAASSSRPAVAIAEANEVPVRQVHRWVAEARDRGHLPPATRGRAG